MSSWIPRAAFLPSLAYNLILEKLSLRTWYSRIDENVLLGALPFRSMTDELVKKENVKGVITLNEEYETRYFVNTAKEWEDLGIKQLRLDTMDLIAAPTQDKLSLGVRFINEIKKTDGTVYVHCKAGRTRSATVVTCYIMEARSESVAVRRSASNPVCFTSINDNVWLLFCHDLKMQMNPEEAFEFVRERRPHVWIRETQWKAIQTYYTNMMKQGPLGSPV